MHCHYRKCNYTIFNTTVPDRYYNTSFVRIRCYERCVVDKSMKLALLTSKNLIITDSPPRTILYTLPLIEFLSLTLVSICRASFSDTQLNSCLVVIKCGAPWPWFQLTKLQSSVNYSCFRTYHNYFKITGTRSSWFPSWWWTL